VPTDDSDVAARPQDGAPPSPASVAPAREKWLPARYRRLLVLVSLVLATTVSAGILTYSGTYWWNYRNFNGTVKHLDVFGKSASKPTHDIDGKDQNILIVGNDDRSTMTAAEIHDLHTGRAGGSLNTDTMMLVHVPANGKKATVISLPRDTYVDIPHHGWNKLNSAYSTAYRATQGNAEDKRLAGVKLLVHTIQNLTGLTIDHFVLIDLIGFYRISNAIGGVWVNMCAPVHDYNSGLNLPKGRSPVQGRSALAFVRQRYNFPNGLGDLDRVQRQRYFLTAAFRALVSTHVLLNPIKLHQLLNAIQSSIYDDPKLDPIALARQMEKLSADNIIGKTIPTTFENGTPVGDVLAVDPAEVKAFVNMVIGSGDSKLDAATPLEPAAVVVRVANGSQKAGAAAHNTAMLTHHHFQAVVDHADVSSTATVIEYPDGMQAQAKTVAEYVPGAIFEKLPNINYVRLVLGSDGLGVSAKPVPLDLPSSSPSATPTKAIDSKCIY
jgi:LCP family protein required for cell wall assembly